MGSVITAPGSTARDCCAGTDEGNSYESSPGVCEITRCIGNIKLLFFCSAFCIVLKIDHYHFIFFHLLVHGFNATKYEVEEGETLNAVFELNVKGNTLQPTTLIIGSITAIAAGSAGEGFPLP